MLTEDEKKALIEEAHALLDTIEIHASNIIQILKKSIENAVKQ